MWCVRIKTQYHFKEEKCHHFKHEHSAMTFAKDSVYTTGVCHSRWDKKRELRNKLGDDTLTLSDMLKIVNEYWWGDERYKTFHISVDVENIDENCEDKEDE